METDERIGSQVYRLAGIVFLSMYAEGLISVSMVSLSSIGIMGFDDDSFSGASVSGPGSRPTTRGRSCG